MTTTFEPDTNTGGYVINAYGAGYVAVNGQHQTTPFILTPALGATAWRAADTAGNPGLDNFGGPTTTESPENFVSLVSLSPADFEVISLLKPEVVLVGTGQRQQFLHPKILAPLLGQRIGVECMSLAAACRTYNILMAEGRKVVGAFLFD